MSNSEADTVDITSSTITITYEAIMILNGATVDGNVYWVSAGAEYDNENKIWVGQASTTVDTADMVSEQKSYCKNIIFAMFLIKACPVPIEIIVAFEARKIYSSIAWLSVFLSRYEKLTITACILTSFIYNKLNQCHLFSEGSNNTTVPY